MGFGVRGSGWSAVSRQSSAADADTERGDGPKLVAGVGRFEGVAKKEQVNPSRDFPNYAPASWGPAAADELLRRDGREWRRPQ